MTPEYLNQLADLADPDELWRLPVLEQRALPAEKRQQLDTGVALRRYAGDVQRLRDLVGTGRSLIMTPLSTHGRYIGDIPTPARHQRFIK